LHVSSAFKGRSIGYFGLAYYLYKNFYSESSWDPKKGNNVKSWDPQKESDVIVRDVTLKKKVH